MGKIERFEDILAWQKARYLVNEICDAIESNAKFRRDYRLNDQIIRASFSIMLNIAEGFGRRTNREFIHFLEVAHGSCCEIESALYISLDRKYMDKNKFKLLYDLCDEISKMIMGLIKYLKGYKEEVPQKL